jgi:hypothetical protein
MKHQKIKILSCLISILLLSFTCEKKEKKEKKVEIRTTHEVTNSDTATPEKSLFGEAVDKGILQNAAITEASGLAASRNNKGLFWTHNDSKDANRLFLFDEKGADMGTFFIENANNRDWEDLEMATINNTPYIYIADIGDNDGKHEKKYIYRVKEPKITASKKPIVDTLRGTETIIVSYPDANRNAEALMIDQKTFDLYIVSKFEDNVVVYQVPYPQSTTAINVAKPIATLPITFVTAGTISLDNQEILIKNIDNIFYWKRKNNESIVAALKRPAKILPYKKEPQGEAIAFAADGGGYYTVSEIKKKILPHLYFYKRL